MTRRPSIELSNLECFAPPLSLPTPDLSNQHPPSENLLHSKENIPQLRSTHKDSYPSQNIKQTLKPINSQLSKPLLKLPLQIRDRSRALEESKKERRQMRTISLPVQFPKPSFNAFRIHHQNITKNTHSPTKYQNFLIKEPKRLSQSRSPNKRLSIEGKPLQTIKEVSNISRESNEIDESVIRSKSSFENNKIKESKDLDKSRKSIEGRGVQKDINMLIGKANKLVLTNQLFKLPKNKQNVLEQRLHQTIKSDSQDKIVAGKSPSQALVVRKGSRDELTMMQGERKGALPWRKKQEEQLTQLKNRLGGNQKLLILK